jgi:hypothetical protein
MPDELLPEALMSANPLSLLRRIDGKLPLLRADHDLPSSRITKL